jgi:hypothetical protein
MTTGSSDHAAAASGHVHKFTDDIKSGLRGIRGAGDAIRGTAMDAVDTAADSKEGEAHDRALVEKGVGDMRGMDQRFTDRRAEHHVAGPAAGETVGQEDLRAPARQDTDTRVQNEHQQQHMAQHQLGHEGAVTGA